MNSAHDLGGAMGFGPVLAEPDEPPFHGDWEQRVFALTLAMGATGAWNLDMSRAARESLPPVQYLSSSYYQIWLAGMERLLIDLGLTTAAEMAAGHLQQTPRPLARRLTAGMVQSVLSRGAPTERQAPGPAQFAVGQTVVTRLMNPAGHVRLPRYVRGRSGVIAAVHGVHVFPDTHATGAGEAPQWLYSVRFAARDLWGPDTTADEICVDCFEPYLQPVAADGR